MFEEADRIFRERQERRAQMDQTGDIPMKSEGQLLVSGNLLTALPDTSSGGSSSGNDGLIPVTVTGCLNGAFAVGVGAYYSAPA